MIDRKFGFWWPLLQSARLLEIPGLLHGYSLRRNFDGTNPLAGNLSFKVGDDEERVKARRQEFFSAVGIRPPATAYAGQIHSDTIVEAVENRLYESCDGLFTNRPGVFLSITVADCLPVLMVDARQRAVAAVHAGWRGSAKRIAAKAAALMAERYGTKAADLVVWGGAAAGACCYEVGPEVASEFPAECVVRRNGRLYLDVKKSNELQLLEAGVLRERMDFSTLCTICRPELFHSYRRDGQGSGRMLAVIGMNN